MYLLLNPKIQTFSTVNNLENLFKNWKNDNFYVFIANSSSWNSEIFDFNFVSDEKFVLKQVWINSEKINFETKINALKKLAFLNGNSAIIWHLYIIKIVISLEAREICRKSLSIYNLEFLQILWP